MNTDMKNRIINLLETYPERQRQIALLLDQAERESGPYLHVISSPHYLLLFQQFRIEIQD